MEEYIKEALSQIDVNSENYLTNKTLEVLHDAEEMGDIQVKLDVLKFMHSIWR